MCPFEPPSQPARARTSEDGAGTGERGGEEVPANARPRRTTYFLGTNACTFTQMLSAYLASSTATEAHTLGMVTALIDAHRRHVPPTAAQRAIVAEDSGGQVSIRAD